MAAEAAWRAVVSSTSSTLGVANKTLPCGTLVTLRYGDRSIRVPVIDRGPYVAGREFDLTEATKDRLGFGGTGNVWSTAERVGRSRAEVGFPAQRSLNLRDACRKKGVTLAGVAGELGRLELAGARGSGG